MFGPLLKDVTLSRTLRGIALLVLAVLFGVQVKDGLVKFLEGKTISTTTTEHYPEMTFPVLTLCPGFRKEAFEGVEMYDHFPSVLSRNVSRNYTEDEVRSWWNGAAYGFFETFEYMARNEERNFSAGAFVSAKEALEGDPTGATFGSGDLMIEQISTYPGKCFVINATRPFKPFESLMVAMNASVIKKIGRGKFCTLGMSQIA